MASHELISRARDLGRESLSEADGKALLREHGVAFCQFDLDGLTSAPIVTGDRVYVRLHGPEHAYSGSYTKAVLQAWADRLQAWQVQGRDVLVFFDNDQGGAGGARCQAAASAGECVSESCPDF